MSPARLHRERLAANAAAPGLPNEIVASDGGGQTAPTVPSAPAPSLAAPSLPAMSPALEHRLAAALAASSDRGDAAAQLAIGVDPAVAQIMLRLTHDLRRLKEIASIERKIDAKREMLPAYRPWCELRLAAGRAVDGHDLPSSGADDVLPTMMVWLIDTGDFANALELAEHVLRFHVPLPSRYERSAPALIVEEIATAAIKVQSTGDRFPVDILDRTMDLTAGDDMHDEIRAKMFKAFGTELAADAAALESDAPAFIAAAERALEPLRRAKQLNDRVGVSTIIKRLEREIGKAKSPPPAPSAPPADATDQTGTGTPPAPQD